MKDFRDSFKYLPNSLMHINLCLSGNRLGYDVEKKKNFG